MLHLVCRNIISVYRLCVYIVLARPLSVVVLVCDSSHPPIVCPVVVVCILPNW